NNPFFERPKINVSAGRRAVQALQIIASISFVGIVAYLFVFTPHQVNGNSMEPNFHNDQLLIVNRITQWLGSSSLGQSLRLDYKRGDVVVFQLASIDIEEGLVKRIIGLPGDKVRISQNSVFINNTRMTEVYIPSGFQTGGGS